MAAQRPPIVVGVDFHASGRAAADAATKLAKDLDLPLVMAHAFHPSGQPQIVPLQGVMAGYNASWDLDEAVRLTTDWAEEARRQGVDVETVAQEGVPSALLLDTARQTGAPFIVVGAKHRSAASRVLLGSVADRVVHKADRPVLVVPEDLASGDED